ncbi:hypothetical protein [Streptomyces niveus]|uniref:hypothetical protein n=1 Tax=Streptomyces niveus TaxID=193462 RepID=UPI00341E9B16
MTKWVLTPEKPPAVRDGRSPLDVVASALVRELTPQGWEIWAYIDSIEVTCLRGRKFTITRDARQDAASWRLGHVANDALSITLTETGSLDVAHHTVSALRFLSYQYSQLKQPPPARDGDA